MFLSSFLSFKLDGGVLFRLKTSLWDSDGLCSFGFFLDLFVFFNPGENKWLFIFFYLFGQSQAPDIGQDKTLFILIIMHHFLFYFIKLHSSCLLLYLQVGNACNFLCRVAVVFPKGVFVFLAFFFFSNSLKLKRTRYFDFGSFLKHWICASILFSMLFGSRLSVQTLQAHFHSLRDNKIQLFKSWQ